jgi:hypothetical protein
VKRLFALALLLLVGGADAAPRTRMYVPTAPVLAAETSAAMSLVVDPAGSDNGPCSAASPCATIPGTLAKVPKGIAHPVVITLNAGNYAGFSLDSFRFMKPASSSAGAYLTIKGTYVAATATTGSSTGTATSGGAGTVGVSGGTLTQTGAGWTVNNFAGKLAHTLTGTGANQYRHIVSNTADTLTVVGTWTAPANGTTFEILDYGAVVNSAMNRPATYLGAEGANSHAIIVAGNTGEYSTSSTTGPLIVLDGLKIAPASGFGIFGYASSTVLMRYSHISTGSSSGCISTTEGSSFIFLQTLLENSSTATLGNFNGAVRTTNVWFKGGNLGLILNGTKGSSLNSNYFSGQGSTSVTLQFGAQSIQFNSNVMVGGGGSTKGINLQSGSTNGDANSIGMQGGTIGGYGTGLQIIGPNFARIDAVVGTGNTTGVLLTTGANLSVSSSVTLTGTTEVSIDGTASDWATMRAASPKVVKNSDYFTIFYE